MANVSLEGVPLPTRVLALLPTLCVLQLHGGLEVPGPNLEVLVRNCQATMDCKRVRATQESVVKILQKQNVSPTSTGCYHLFPSLCVVLEEFCNIVLEKEHVDAIHHWVLNILNIKKTMACPPPGEIHNATPTTSSIAGCGIQRSNSNQTGWAAPSTPSVSCDSMFPSQTMSSFEKSKVARQDVEIRLLRKMLEEHQSEALQKENHIRVLKQQLKRSLETNDHLEAELKEWKENKQQKLAIQRHQDIRDFLAGKPYQEGESVGWLTPQGVIALAIRRNLSNCATSDLGLVLMCDISRWTVTRAEVKASACLLASSRLFWTRWREDVLAGGYSTTVIGYRQDATNSAIWNRCKLMGLEMDASYIHGLDMEDYEDIDSEDFAYNKRLADVLPVHDETGIGTVMMSQKMLDSLGCPTWKTFLNAEKRDTNDDLPSEYCFLPMELPCLFSTMENVTLQSALHECDLCLFCSFEYSHTFECGMWKLIQF